MVMKKKTFIFSVLTILSLSLISCNAVSENTTTEKDIKFYAEDAQTLETITIDEKSNELSLGTNINKSIYSEKLNKYIILDNDRNLFTLDSNKNKEKIASYVDNIEDMDTNSTTIYYITSKGELYERVKDSTINTLIDENIQSYGYLTDNLIYYFIVDYNRTVIKVDSKGKEEELAWEVMHSIPYLDTMVSNSEGSLFIGNEKLDDDLYHFMVFEDNLVYLKSNGQVFLKEPNKKPQLILDDFYDYLNVYFNDERLFVNLLDLNFLTGYWIQEDTTYGVSMMEINEDIFTEVSKYSMRMFDIGVNSLKYNEIELYLDGYKEQIRVIKKIDKNTIDLGTVKYIRTDKETYDAFVKQIQETGLNFNDYQ